MAVPTIARMKVANAILVLGLALVAGWGVSEGSEPSAEALSHEAAGVSAETPAAGLRILSRDSRCGQVIATCLVEGRPARLMIDTGATHTVLHSAFVARSLPHAERVENARLAGNARQQPDLLRVSLEAGGVSFPREDVLAMDLSGVNALLDAPVDGILGMSHLSRLSFTFDLRPGCRPHWGAPSEPLPLRRWEGRRDAAGRLHCQVRSGAGNPEWLLLDTGSTMSSISPAHWPAGARESGSEQPLRTADVNGEHDVRRTVGATASLELAPGVVSPRLSPVLREDPTGNVLGMDALEGLVLVHRAGEGFFVGPVEEEAQKP